MGIHSAMLDERTGPARARRAQKGRKFQSWGVTERAGKAATP